MKIYKPIYFVLILTMFLNILIVLRSLANIFGNFHCCIQNNHKLSYCLLLFWGFILPRTITYKWNRKKKITNNLFTIRETILELQFHITKSVIENISIYHKYFNLKFTLYSFGIFSLIHYAFIIHHFTPSRAIKSLKDKRLTSCE